MICKTLRHAPVRQRQAHPKRTEHIQAAETYRRQVRQTCAALVGTKFDVLSEIAEWDESPLNQWLLRAERVVRWLTESLAQVDALVKRLQSVSEKDAAYIPLYVLAAKNATGMIAAFQPVAAAARAAQIAADF